MSARASTGCPRHCSGAAYPTVPTNIAGVVCAVACAAGSSGMTRAMPKSRIFAWSSGVRIDVPGLQIAVDDALRVRRRQRVGELTGNRQRRGRGQRPLREPGSERVALDELEDDDDLSVDVQDVMNGGDVRVGERGGGPRLRQELRARMLAARLGSGKRLECDEPRQPRVFGQQDRTHAAPADGPHHTIWADFGWKNRHGWA